MVPLPAHDVTKNLTGHRHFVFPAQSWVYKITLLGIFIPIKNSSNFRKKTPPLSLFKKKLPIRAFFIKSSPIRPKLVILNLCLTPPALTIFLGLEVPICKLFDLDPGDVWESSGPSLHTS